MVSIMLSFVREHRDGLWDLHMYAFKRMLPFFFRYDRIHYARWGAVYLAEMAVLPSEILREFQRGNFVVKCSDRRFFRLLQNLKFCILRNSMFSPHALVQ